MASMRAIEESGAITSRSSSAAPQLVTEREHQVDAGAVEIGGGREVDDQHRRLVGHEPRSATPTSATLEASTSRTAPPASRRAIPRPPERGRSCRHPARGSATTPGGCRRRPGSHRPSPSSRHPSRFRARMRSAWRPPAAVVADHERYDAVLTGRGHLVGRRARRVRVLDGVRRCLLHGHDDVVDLVLGRAPRRASGAAAGAWPRASRPTRARWSAAPRAGAPGARPATATSSSAAAPRTAPPRRPDTARRDPRPSRTASEDVRARPPRLPAHLDRAVGGQQQRAAGREVERVSRSACRGRH